MAASALLLERPTSRTIAATESLCLDWESPAAGMSALPRIGGLSFTYVGHDDEHLYGQGCLSIEPLQPLTEERLVAFACGCRARVSELLLEPR